MQTSVFHKKTCTGLLLDYFSFVPNCYKLGLIKTLVDRMYRINNSRTGFDKDLKDLKNILQKNQYHVLFQQKFHIKVNTIPRLFISLFELAVMLVMLVRLDKKSHIYQHLISSEECLDKCSKDCFFVLDAPNTKH